MPGTPILALTVSPFTVPLGSSLLSAQAGSSRSPHRKARLFLAFTSGVQWGGGQDAGVLETLQQQEPPPPPQTV